MPPPPAPDAPRGRFPERVLLRRLAAAWRSHHWLFLAGLGALAAILGIAGFLEPVTGGDKRTVLDAVYLSIQLFVMESGSTGGPVPWPLEIARFLAPATTAYAAAVALRTLLHDQFEAIRIARWREHIVIAGLGRKGLQIAADFRAVGERVVVIERQDPSENAARCDELGVVVVTGDATRTCVLRSAGVHRARLLFCTGPDDSTNVEVALAAGDLLAEDASHADAGRSRSATSRDPTSSECWIHIEDPDLRNRLESQARHRLRLGGLRVRFFNAYQEGARMLLDEFPPAELPQAGAADPRDVLVIGCGRMGEALVVQMARACDYGDGRPLRVTVLDRRATAIEGDLRERFPALTELAGLRFTDVDTRNDRALRTCLGHFVGAAVSVAGIYICLGSDADNLHCALTLERLFAGRPLEIVVRMESERGLSVLLPAAVPAPGQRHGTPPVPRVRRFGIISSGCRNACLLPHERDALARVFHAAMPGPSGIPWELLPEESRESHRDQAAHIPVKLRVIGYCAYPMENERPATMSLTASDIERLARMEHARSRAERLLGSEPAADGAAPGPVAGSVALVWEQLPEVERDVYRERVRPIPALLASIGMGLRRLDG